MFRKLLVNSAKPFGFLAGAAAVWTPNANPGNLDQQPMNKNERIHVEYSERFHSQPSHLHKSVFRYGQPTPFLMLSYANHVVCYDLERKIPRYVAECITKEHISGPVSRQNVSQENGGFKSDPAVENMFSSVNDDYRHSGWSRGHMAAAANHKHDLNAMSDTFYLTNIVPQDGDNNSGFWNRLEWYCRGLAKRYDAVYVITGPLFIAQQRVFQEKNTEKRTLTVGLIGRSGVHIPTHLYKAVLVEKRGKPVAVAAFIVPNQPLPSSAKISDFQVSLADLERFAGMKLFQLVKSFDVKDLCDSDESHCRLTSDEEKRFTEFEEKRRKVSRGG